MDEKEKNEPTHLDTFRRTLQAYANDYEWDVLHDEPDRFVVQKRYMKLAFDEAGIVYGYDTKSEEFAFRDEYADEVAIKDLMTQPLERFGVQA